MEHNPFASPLVAESSNSPRPPSFKLRIVAPIGFAMGFSSYMIALALAPEYDSSIRDFDKFCAVAIGFTYSNIIGFWLGYCNRRTINTFAILGTGCLTGILIGTFLYFFGSNTLSILFVPAICSTVIAVAVLIQHRLPLGKFLKSTGKAFLAGAVLGTTYLVLRNLMGLKYGLGFAMSLEYHISMMWRIGPLALGGAGAVFLPVLSWATAHEA